MTLTGNKALAVLCIAAAIAFSACSQNAEKTSDGPVKGPAMWRVHDVDSNVYLFGTFHILPANLGWTTPAFDKAMAQTPVTVTEVDTTSAAAKAETARLVQELGLNPPGVTLSSTLGPERAARFKKVADDYGVPMIALENMRPWLAMVSLSVLVMQKEGFDPDNGAEETILDQAKKEGDSVEHLESVDFQIRTLAAMDEAEILADLDESLDQAEDFKGYMKRVLDAWSNGDVAALEKETVTDMREGAPKVFKALITDRNKAWVGKIEDMLAGDEDYFIAVGAGHLVGDGSVIDLLQKDGVTVERVQ